MKSQTKKIIKLLLDADETVSGIQKAQVLKILEQKLARTIKIFLTQREAAQALSVSRQTVHNMVKRGVLHPVDISGQGLMRYRMDDLQNLRVSEF